MKNDYNFASSNDGLTSILDGLDSLVYVVDFNTYEILFINKNGRNIWGDIQGQKCWQTIQADQVGPCSFCTSGKLLSDSGIPTGVYQWQFQNTVTGRWYDCRDQAIPWKNKGLVRMEIAIDITDRKQAEEKLLQSEENFRSIFENNSTAMAIIEPDTTISMVNEEYCKVGGFTREEVIGTSWTQQIPPPTLND